MERRSFKGLGRGDDKAIGFCESSYYQVLDLWGFPINMRGKCLEATTILLDMNVVTPPTNRDEMAYPYNLVPTYYARIQNAVHKTLKTQ